MLPLLLLLEPQIFTAYCSRKGVAQDSIRWGPGATVWCCWHGEFVNARQGSVCAATPALRLSVLRSDLLVRLSELRLGLLVLWPCIHARHAPLDLPGLSLTASALGMTRARHR